MVDRDLILAKASSVKSHLQRVDDKIPKCFEEFNNNQDNQDIILFNLQMAIQNCIDIAAHIISEEGYGVPGSTNDMFYLLEENSYISQEIAEKMVQAVGFRNLIVHEYGKIDLKLVFRTIQSDLNDLYDYLKAIFIKSGISNF